VLLFCTTNTYCSLVTKMTLLSFKNVIIKFISRYDILCLNDFYTIYSLVQTFSPFYYHYYYILMAHVGANGKHSLRYMIRRWVVTSSVAFACGEICLTESDDGEGSVGWGKEMALSCPFIIWWLGDSCVCPNVTTWEIALPQYGRDRNIRY